MNFIIADTFTKSLAKLDAQAQSLIKQAAFDFQLSPANPGFRFHKLDRAKDKNFSSFRVTDDLRIIVHRGESTFTLCYADHHDHAYAWAEKRRFEVHPQTGAIQIVEVKEKIEEVIRYIEKTIEKEAALFEKHNPDYLLALGIPLEWLDAVRQVGESGFDKLIDHLPQEAVERLMELACGNPVPIPNKVVSENPFSHPDSQRRFRVIDNQNELHQALESPWEQWIIFLHPSQRAVAEKRFTGSARISGGAGTGKTVVALHRAAYLSRSNPNVRVLLTTYSRTLAARLSYQADLLMGKDSSERKHIEIEHLHKIARDILVNRIGKRFVPMSPKQLSNIIDEVNNSNQLSTPFLKSEWDSIIDPLGIDSWDAYKKISRVGRGTPLGAKQRLVIWNIFEKVFQLMESKHLMTWSGLCHHVASFLEQHIQRPYDHVIADECQDFGPAELRLLCSLFKPGQNDLFICSDAGQQIYKPRFSWASVGINIRGRSTRLKLNYRTTEQIRCFADGLLPEAIDEGEGEKESRHTISLFNGSKPQIQGFDNVSEEIKGVSSWLDSLLKEGYKMSEIAIFSRTENILKERAKAALDLHTLSYQYLNDEETLLGEHISLGTIHRAKGLEFKAVILMGCDSKIIPYNYALQEIVDEADRQAFVEQERQLLYVACTRARERLFLSYTGNGSKLLIK